MWRLDLGVEVNPFIFSAERKKQSEAAARYDQPDSEPKTEINRAVDRNKRKAEIQRLEAATR
jgi:hypothetical protein